MEKPKLTLDDVKVGYVYISSDSYYNSFKVLEIIPDENIVKIDAWVELLDGSKHSYGLMEIRYKGETNSRERASMEKRIHLYSIDYEASYRAIVAEEVKEAFNG